MKEIKLSDSTISVFVAESLNACIKAATEEYLEPYDQCTHPKYEDVEEELLNVTNAYIDDYNQYIAGKNKAKGIARLKKLEPSQIADVLLAFNHIKRVKCVDVDNVSTFDIIAVYKEQEGIYRYDADYLHNLCERISYTITEKEISEVDKKLYRKAPLSKRTKNPDLIPLNNGIFDFKKKELIDFTPDFIFTFKSPVSYNPAATNVIIHNDQDGTDWDVETWMNELSDDPEIVNVLWEILAVLLRPYVSWGKSAWLYSECGNNGKGTYCVLGRELVGNENAASLPLSNFGERFGTGCIIGKSCIITDENDVGTYIDRVGKLKSIVTHDTVRLEIKYQNSVDYQFFGFMIQCLNEYPRVKDRSDSFYRRQLFVPFTKCFTGAERKYIKDDYLHRPEVLEYVLYKVLNMDFYALSEPQACKLALEDYKTFNDPTRQFLDEMLPQLKWSLIPRDFLYCLYKSYFRRNNPSGSPLGKNKFYMEVRGLIGSYPDWEWREAPVKRGNLMDATEYLICEYGLNEWMNNVYTGGDWDKLCNIKLQDEYRGLLRVKKASNDDPTDEPEDKLAQ